MKGWKETLRKYRLSILICVLSFPVYLLVQYLLNLLYDFLLSFRLFLHLGGNGVFIWVMGIFFFLALVFALDAFAKDRKK